MMGFYTIIRLTSGFALSALLLSSSGVALASDASASALAVQARAQLDAGNVTRAELLYAQAMQEAPGDVGLSMTLAEIYIAQRRFDEADRLIATTLLVQPSDYRIWKTRGQLQRAQGNEAGAISDYEKAFSLGGREDMYVLQNLQQHYEKTKNDGRKKQMENNLQSLKAKNTR